MASVDGWTGKQARPGQAKCLAQIRLLKTPWRKTQPSPHASAPASAPRPPRTREMLARNGLERLGCEPPFQNRQARATRNATHRKPRGRREEPIAAASLQNSPTPCDEVAHKGKATMRQAWLQDVGMSNSRSSEQASKQTGRSGRQKAQNPTNLHLRPFSI